MKEDEEQGEPKGVVVESRSSREAVGPGGMADSSCVTECWSGPQAGCQQAGLRRGSRHAVPQFQCAVRRPSMPPRIPLSPFLAPRLPGGLFHCA